MEIGALAGGLADGFQSGYRTGILGANLKSQQENEAKRLKIAEEQNARQGELQGLQIAGAKRAMEREQALEAAHKQALQIMSGATGARMDPNMPADQQIARFVTGGLNDPRTLSAVADVYAQAGHPDAAKWIERGLLAKKEGVLDMADALKRGDTAEAKRLYNAVGSVRLADIKTMEGKEGTPIGRYRLKFEDGEEGDVDPDSLMRSVFSYSEWRKMQDDARKAQLDAEKNAAEVRAKNASASKDEGANATAIEVARIGADKARDVKSMDIDARASGILGGRGGGRGRGAGGNKEPDPWKDAEQRNKVLKDVDDFARNQYGDPGVGTKDGERAHNEQSRKVGRAAQMILSASIQAGDQNMTPEWATKIAADGTPSFEMPEFSNGRLVTKQTITYDGVKYPLNTAVKPADKDQVLQFIDHWAGVHKEATKKPTADQLRAEPEIKAAAKQAGMSVDDVVNRILGQQPAPKPQQGAAAPATRGIVSEAGAAPLASRSGTSAPRRGGIAGEIQALEERLSAIPDDGRLSTKNQRGEIEKKITQLRGIAGNQDNREAVIPSQRVATAAKVRELEDRLAKIPDDGRLSTKQQRNLLQQQIEELKSALRRSAGGGITREAR